MADDEPSDDFAASSVEPVRWPDPSRPIVYEQPGYGQGEPWVRRGPGTRVPIGPRRRRWPAITTVLVLLVLALVVVWLLWWR